MKPVKFNGAQSSFNEYILSKMCKFFIEFVEDITVSMYFTTLEYRIHKFKLNGFYQIDINYNMLLNLG